MKRDLIIFALVLASFYMGATITDTRHERDKRVAVENALRQCENRDCKTQQVMDTLMRMSENGFNVTRYGLCWASDKGAVPRGEE